MGWKTFHRRSEVLRRVIEEANRRCDGQLPTELPGVDERFVNPSDLLAALQLRWYNHLSGAIEVELCRHPADPEGAVVAAWCRAAAHLPGVRMILDEHFDTGRAHPAGRRKEWALLSGSARRASGTEDRMLAEGHRIENRARRALAAFDNESRGESTRAGRSELVGQLRPRARSENHHTSGGDKCRQTHCHDAAPTSAP